jgi:hypothetical protein
MSLLGRPKFSRVETDPLGYWSSRKAPESRRPVLTPSTARPLAPFPKVSRPRGILAPAVHKKYGPARYGLKTHVVPGKRITILGLVPPGHRYVGPRPGDVNKGPMQIRRVFRMGDTALYGGFNLDYMGTIRGITENRVTIVEHEGRGTGRDVVHMLSLYDFAEKNWDFDEAKSRKRNAEWMD